MLLGLVLFPFYHTSALLWSVTLCKQRDNEHCAQSDRAVLGGRALWHDGPSCSHCPNTASNAVLGKEGHWQTAGTLLFSKVRLTKIRELSDDFWGFLAKNTNQAPLSKLDSRRGNSLADYVKKRERQFPEWRKKKTCWGRRQLQPPASYANSHRWREWEAEMWNLPLLVPIPSVWVEETEGPRYFIVRYFAGGKWHTSNYIIFMDFYQLKIKSQSFIWFEFLMEKCISIHTGISWLLLKLLEPYRIF